MSEVSAAGFRESEIGKLVRGIAVIAAAALMILPAYIIYEIGPVKIGFQPAPAMGITLMLFAIGIIVFILAVGPEKFKPKTQVQ